MSYEDDKAQSIAISVGINAAAQLAKNATDPAAYFTEIADSVIGVVLDAHKKFAIEKVGAAFPGTTQVPFTPPAAVAAPAAVQAAPAAIPGVADGDPATAALWQQLFTDKTNGVFEANWYDNRTTKKSPKGPDFKNKKDGDKALWIVGRNNPSWVPAALAQTGLG